MKTLVIQSGKGGAAGRHSLGKSGRLTVVSAHVVLEAVPTAESLSSKAKYAIES